MTKTQKYLIEQAKKYDGYAVDCGGGRGAFGGRISFGNRERVALQKLVEQGLAVIVHQDSSPTYNNGNCVWVTTFSFQLTQKAA